MKPGWILPLSLLTAPVFAQGIIKDEAVPQTIIAQVTNDCADLDAGSIDALICQDDGLRAVDGAMQSVWSSWVEGINAQRIDYLKQEQSEWLAARAECLSETDATACLQSRYEARIQVLSKPRIFQRVEIQDGAEFNIRSAMTPISFDGLEIELALEGKPVMQPVLEEFQKSLTEPIEEGCPLCTRERMTWIKNGYDDERVAILICQQSESHNGDDPVRNDQIMIFDKVTGKKISFMELFDPSTAPFAKETIVKQILAALDHLNRKVEGNENGDTQYYWAETEINLHALSNEEWDRMGLFPVLEDGKITGFRYYADSYEFAPYGSSDYFSGFEIDAAPIVAFLKPEYRASFH